MNRKPSKYALIALFLALLYLPVPVNAIIAGSTKDQSLENRVLAQRPELSLDTISEFPRAYEAYYADHQPLRNQLIFTRALLSKTLYDRDVSQQVLFGKNGWLFYNFPADGPSIADYRGETFYTEKELRQIASDLMKTRSALKKIGCEFVLIIEPNKERAYSEYMPDRYGPPAESYGAMQLVRYLQRHSKVKVIYAWDALMQAKRDFPDIDVYFPRDTHWNNVGSYVGTREVMRQIGVEFPELTREMIQVPEPDRTGDLSVLAHLEACLPKDIDYTVTNPDGSPFSGPAQAVEGPKKKLFLYRDSFGEYMEDYLFTCFSREDSFVAVLELNDAMIDAVQPDVFVMEVVERYLRPRLLSGPLYHSPEDREPEAQDS